MNKGIAHALMLKLSNLEWFTVAAGLAQTITQVDTTFDDNGNGRKIVKKLPATCDAITRVECPTSEGLTLLIPDSKYKGMFYFEDQGTSFIGRSYGYMNYLSRLRLIVWLNGAYAGDTECFNLGSAIASKIIQILTEKPFNQGYYTKVAISVAGIPIVSSTIFSQYSYDEAVTQYLMQPFEYFAIDFSVSFSVSPNCITNIPVIDPTC